jgi:cytochrome c biogenesis factor
VSDLGALALRFALPVALLGIAAGVYAGVTRKSEWTLVAERAVWTVAAFVTLGIVALFSAFATHDFQLSYVASHSARSMALP